jgi:hypothetical protein
MLLLRVLLQLEFSLLLDLRVWLRRGWSACWHGAPVQVRVPVLVPGMRAQLLPPRQRPLARHW